MMQNNTYPVWTNEALTLLLKWHREDPVSEKELKRQEAVYQIQHNRNPFIDYPEMVEHIWGNKKEIAIILPKETRPLLTSPHSWDKIECAVSYIGTTSKKIVRFEGANYTSNLPIKLANRSSEISLSTEYLTPNQITNGYDLTISITCNEIKNVIDTLLICTTDTIKLPISAMFSDEFMITSAEALNPATASVQWTELPNAQKYEITLTDAIKNRTSDLLFAAYVEGSSYNKAISIYNGTGKTIDLKYYSLRKQSNGTGALKLDYPLSGTLKNGECYVIVNNSANADLKNIANKLVSSPINEDNILNFNGNDVIALYHNGMLIDMIGELNNSADWGKDLSLERDINVINPNANFDWNEWTKYDKDDFSHIKQHSVKLSSTANIIATYTSTKNSITIEGLTPNKTYYAEVKSGNKQSVNIITFKTPEISTPEAYEATNIYATQFTANWEQISYAKGYIVELMQMATGEETTIKEGFNSVGPKGTPLPEGWSGTASGNYTSEASSGKSPNSIALKNDGEYLQTPITQDPITYCEFMYRFPSAATGSYFIVYAVDLQGNINQIEKIEYANSTKKFTFQTSELNNAYAIRIEYHKSAGNLAIDDFIYKYGGTKIEVLATKEATSNWFIFDDLKPNTNYSYQVNCIINDNYTTEASNIINVSTNNTPAPPPSETTQIITPTEYKYYISNNTLYIEGLSTDSEVNIYNIQGIKIYNNTKCLNMTIPFLKQGIYVSQVKNNNQITTFKFVIR